MESEDSFFQIQQIQEKTQILEDKKKQFRDISQRFNDEINQLEQLDEEIDNKYQKAKFEMRLLGSTGVPDTFDTVDNSSKPGSSSSPIEIDDVSILR